MYSMSCWKSTAIGETSQLCRLPDWDICTDPYASDLYRMSLGLGSGRHSTKQLRRVYFRPSELTWFCLPLSSHSHILTSSLSHICFLCFFPPTVCTLCPMGRWLSDVRADELTDCIKCLIGTYLNEKGKTLPSDCIDCTLGRYADQPGAMSLDDVAVAMRCKGCPMGKYGDTLKADDLNKCKDCTVGRYNDQLGRIMNVGPNPLLDNPGDCKPCPQGRYNDQNGQGLLNNGCTQCGKGKVS